MQTVLLDHEPHGVHHGLCKRRVVEDRWIVNERRHRPTLALEIGHAAPLSLGGQRHRQAGAVEIRPGNIRPVQHSEGRIAQDRSQSLLELAGCRVPTQLDHEATGRRVSPLRPQLARDEPDRHDAVFLRRVQQPFAGALARGIGLEGDLVEPGERIAHVRLVVDR